MRYDKLIDSLQNLIHFRPTQQALASILGIAQTAINGRAKRNSNFSDEEIRKIEQFYCIDLTGSNNNDCINIPVHGDIQASMGYGVEVYSETQTATYSISAQLIKTLGINPNKSHIIFGLGNSMEPTILGGDSLLVDLSKKDIVDGKIYCVRYDGQLYTKRLQRLSKTKLKMISDNKDYEPIFIDFNEAIDFEVIGEIRWCGRIFW